MVFAIGRSIADMDVRQLYSSKPFKGFKPFVGSNTWIPYKK